MKIAILTFDGFNELDSLIAYSILNRVKGENWQVQITSPTPTVTSMNGLTISAQQPLAYASQADAVIFGSGSRTRELIADENLLRAISVNPNRQLLTAQCSGVLWLSALGLVEKTHPVCTDLTTQPWAMDAGLFVLEQPFYASQSIATAGGCLASQYLSMWLIAKTAGVSFAKSAMHYVAPVGEKEDTVNHCLSVIGPYLE